MSLANHSSLSTVYVSKISPSLRTFDFYQNSSFSNCFFLFCYRKLYSWKFKQRSEVQNMIRKMLSTHITFAHQLISKRSAPSKVAMKPQAILCSVLILACSFVPKSKWVQIGLWSPCSCMLCRSGICYGGRWNLFSLLI